MDYIPKENAYLYLLDDIKRGVALTACFAAISGGSLVEVTNAETWSSACLAFMVSGMSCCAALNFGKKLVFEKVKEYFENP